MKKAGIYELDDSSSLKAQMASLTSALNKLSSSKVVKSIATLAENYSKKEGQEVEEVQFIGN